MKTLEVLKEILERALALRASGEGEEHTVISSFGGEEMVETFWEDRRRGMWIYEVRDQHGLCLLEVRRGSVQIGVTLRRPPFSPSLWGKLPS